MRKVKPNEAIPVTHPIFMLYGVPGICKSSLGYSAPKPLCLDFDHGAHRAVNRNGVTWIMESWKDVEEITVEALAPFDSVVMDTVGRALDMITADIGEKDPKLVRGGAPTLQGWGVLKARFRQWVSLMRTHNKFLIMISHHKEESDGDLKVVRPDIQGGSYGEVMKIADFVGFVRASGGKRVLDFNPTDRWVGKNPAQWDQFEIPPIVDAKTFLADRIASGVAALGQMSQDNASAADTILDWTAKIKDMTTAVEMNEAIPEILTLPKVLQAQISKVLLQVAADLKIDFDKASKVFVEPKVEKKQGPAEAGSELPFG